MLVSVVHYGTIGAMNRRDLRPRTRLDPQERREAILAAAYDVFGAAGWSGATLSAIAAASGSSEALIYRYFAGKDQLYADLVRRSIEELDHQRTAAVAALAAGTPTRERIKVVITTHLDIAAARPVAWAQPLLDLGDEPPEIATIRAAARADFLTELRQWLPQHTLRHSLAAEGFLGFLDSTCRSWVVRGCPAEDYWTIVEVGLGALEGALGDWVS